MYANRRTKVTERSGLHADRGHALTDRGAVKQRPAGVEAATRRRKAATRRRKAAVTCWRAPSLHTLTCAFEEDKPRTGGHASCYLLTTMKHPIG